MPMTTLNFNGTEYAGATMFNNAPNVFNLFHNSPVSGSLAFNTDSPPVNPSDPNTAMYTNTVSGFTFLNEMGSASIFNYTYVNIAPAYGYLQFYVNTIHDGLSDVFTLNFYATPGSFQLGAFNFANVGNSIPAWGEWYFHRHDFAANQTVIYGGSVTSYEFRQPSNTIPEPAGYQLLLSGAILLAFSRSRGRRAGT